MARLTELERDDQEEILLACDAIDGDYLRITWDNDDPDFRYLWLEINEYPLSFRRKIRAIWRIVRGKQHPWGEVILNDKAVQELAAFFNTKTKD